MGRWGRSFPFPHLHCRQGLLFCLFMRHVTAMLLFFGVGDHPTVSSVIAEALVLSVVTCDIITAKVSRFLSAA
jgi:hypothetical protein